VGIGGRTEAMAEICAELRVEREFMAETEVMALEICVAVLPGLVVDARELWQLEQ